MYVGCWVGPSSTDGTFAHIAMPHARTLIVKALASPTFTIRMPCTFMRLFDLFPAFVYFVGTYEHSEYVLCFPKSPLEYA